MVSGKLSGTGTTGTAGTTGRGGGSRGRNAEGGGMYSSIVGDRTRGGCEYGVMRGTREKSPSGDGLL